MAQKLGMKTVRGLGLTLIVTGLVNLWGCGRSFSPTLTAAPSPSPVPAIAEPITDQVDQRSAATIYTLVIPAAFVVTPAVAATTAPVAEFAQRESAIAVINAGFFDPSNQLSTAYVTIGGKLVADPRRNDRLMQNPQLAPYLTPILHRSEFRRYQCGPQQRYAIVPHQTPTPPGCQLVDALGAGPQLLPVMTLEKEGFLARSPTQIIRDPLGSSQPNARSAIGLKRDGSVVIVMVQQTGDRPGLSLAALADYLKTLGVEQALNLDGGSSSALFYNGQLQIGKFDPAGKAQRPVKSVLIVRPLSMGNGAQLMKPIDLSMGKDLG
jgi:hypothetical protein